MSENEERSPFVIEGVTKEYLWAGKKLAKEWGKRGDKISESWELSALVSNESRIKYGKNTGEKLTEFLSEDMTGLKEGEVFPILIKLIDSDDMLSIQVHPNDELAQKLENKPYGKTELWYILDCEKGAGIYNGFNRDVTREEVENSIKDGNLEKLLNFVEVKPCDTFPIPSGRIHAIGKGITLLEIQQSSDITYRVYDFNRVGKDGKLRELHVEKALQALSFEKTEIPEDNRLKECEVFGGYYVAEREINGESFLFSGKRFSSFTVIKDNGLNMDGQRLYKGETVFMPKNTKAKLTGAGSVVQTIYKGE